jgi:hypothetical protein
MTLTCDDDVHAASLIDTLNAPYIRVCDSQGERNKL